MSFIAGIRANNNAQRIADEVEDRGRLDARLRRIAATQLIDDIRNKDRKRNVDPASITSTDKQREAAILEGMDIDRIKFRAALEAHNIRLQGKAALAQSIVQTFDSVANVVQVGIVAGSAIRSGDAARQMGVRMSNIEIQQFTLLNPGTRNLTTFDPAFGRIA